MEKVYTQQDMAQIAQDIMAQISVGEGATIITLKGDLGAGKTTLTQAIALHLGVSEVVTSPTFVIAKFYDTQNAEYKKLVHIDAYRIEEPHELVVLGWEEIVSSQNTLVIIEWPEKIQELLDKEKNTHDFFIENSSVDTRKIKKYEK